MDKSYNSDQYIRWTTFRLTSAPDVWTTFGTTFDTCLVLIREMRYWGYHHWAGCKCPWSGTQQEDFQRPATFSSNFPKSDMANTETGSTLCSTLTCADGWIGKEKLCSLCWDTSLLWRTVTGATTEDSRHKVKWHTSLVTEKYSGLDIDSFFKHMQSCKTKLIFTCCSAWVEECVGQAAANDSFINSLVCKKQCIESSMLLSWLQLLFNINLAKLGSFLVMHR